MHIVLRKCSQNMGYFALSFSCVRVLYFGQAVVVGWGKWLTRWPRRSPEWKGLNVLHLIRFAEVILKVCLCIHYTCCWLKDLVEVLEGQQRLMIGTPRGFRTEGMVLPRSILLCKRLLHVQGSFPCGFFCTTPVPSAVLSAYDWRFVFHSQTCCTWAKSSFGR